MKTMLLIVPLLAALTGCRNDNLPFELEDAEPPLTIIANTDEGIIVSDGKGKIYAYKSSYYFAKIIMSSELKAGDIIACKMNSYLK